MTDIKYGGMMCPHGHVKAACAICATPPKSPPMTDPKPATPATDDYVPDYPNWGFGGGSHLEYQAQLAWESRYGLAVDSNPVIKLIKQRASLIRERDERDDIIKAERVRADKYEAESEQKGADLMAAESVIAEQDEEIEALRQAFGLLSTLAPNVVMGPSSPAEVIVTAREIHKGVFEEIERLRSSAGSRTEQNARAQVETLREALKAALGHCDCSDYHGKALIPCTEANPCAGCYTTRIGHSV